MTDLPPMLGELLAPDDPSAFMALIEIMDAVGCRFVVKSPEDVGYCGRFLPDWCDDVIVVWFDLLVTASLTAGSHRLYACTSCCFPMLLTSDRKGRRCPACDAKAAMTYPLPVHFTDRRTP